MFESAQVRGAVRKAVAAMTAFMLAMVLLIALLITGLYLLVQAAIMGLAPIIGEAASMAVVGFACVLLLAIFFWRMMNTGSSPKRREGKGAGAASTLDELRELIRENPLESAFTAFAVGIAQQSDPRLRELLLQGGMELMKRTGSNEERTSSDRKPPGGAAQA
ncbi:hypothetical protein [Marinobacter gudaonensis]|uniref:hypothetical protein n=1 Tax=Marinobacter gudaonensis TaxID=375760 RepID=UPI000B8A0B49|nr:hypothetical protein [Marinobacter gudaonensis]